MIRNFEKMAISTGQCAAVPVAESSLQTQPAAAMALMHAPSFRAAWRYMNFKIAVCLKVESPRFDGLPGLPSFSPAGSATLSDEGNSGLVMG